MMELMLCEAWTSHDDVTGYGQMTFYHECGKGPEHSGKHSCIGHMDLNTGEADTCREEW
jgi:hypothetical protein